MIAAKVKLLWLQAAIRRRQRYLRAGAGGRPVELLISRMWLAAKRGYLLPDEFEAIGKRKSPQMSILLGQNKSSEIRDATRFAYSATDERQRIDRLCTLRGVAVPRASCLLAWVYPEKWGVIDRRAWTVLVHYRVVNSRLNGRNLGRNQWAEYVEILNELSKTFKVTPRAIDVWLYRHHDDLFRKVRCRKWNWLGCPGYHRQ
jgi:hypothetical protein